MSMRPRMRLSIWYLLAAFAAASFFAASVGYAAGSRRVPEIVFEACGERASR